MKVPYGEGLAIHTGSESCGGVCEDMAEEAEFVIYNYGDHSLSRGSRSDTLDVNRRMLDWFEKYLKED